MKEKKEDLLRFDELVKSFRRNNHFNVNIITDTPQVTAKSIQQFTRDLEDLMLRNKVIQVVASMLAKL